MTLYRTILVDPPWPQKLRSGGLYRNRPTETRRLPYPTMPVEAIAALPVARLAAEGCHLWLWTTNQFLRAGFEVMEAWGFNFLAPITWVKPQGLGNWFQHRTQTILFGYRTRCIFSLARYKPTVFCANIGKHSQKPIESYELIESVSPAPRIELFARPVSELFPKRLGWHVWGNEVESDISL